MVGSTKKPRISPRVSYEVLEDWLSHALRRAGMNDAEATATAHALAEADLRGVHSHGAVRLPVYVALMRKEVWIAGAEPKILVDHGVLSLLDGCCGIGPYIATLAMRLAVARARDHGAGWVWVRNAGHFGAAATYTLQAARQGFIGFAFTNSSPAMAPWGGKEMVLGTNPWSVAVPAPQGAWPIVLDLANTVVARGKIRAAQDKGEEIPEGWALDSTGKPTTNPELALEGSLLPFGGYKGYGISFMMEVLTGVVSGAAIASEVESPYSVKAHQGLGQAFAAIDVARLLPLNAFRARMVELVNYVRGAKRKAGVIRILLPGEREAALAKKQARTGILLPEEVHKAIRTAARDLGLAVPM